uniref:Uncharacterized protein n=1 Tax=Oryza nivara TaxID=4536 RepID=A0A0E0IZT6_ORYNI
MPAWTVDEWNTLASRDWLWRCSSPSGWRRHHQLGLGSWGLEASGLRQHTEGGSAEAEATAMARAVDAWAMSARWRLEAVPVDRRMAGGGDAGAVETGGGGRAVAALARCWRRRWHGTGGGAGVVEAGGGGQTGGGIKRDGEKCGAVLW